MNFVKELLQYKNSVKNTLLSQANEPQNRDLRSLTCSGHESVGLLKNGSGGFIFANSEFEFLT